MVMKIYWLNQTKYIFYMCIYFPFSTIWESLGKCCFLFKHVLMICCFYGVCLFLFLLKACTLHVVLSSEARMNREPHLKGCIRLGAVLTERITHFDVDRWINLCLIYFAGSKEVTIALNSTETGKLFLTQNFTYFNCSSFTR